MLQAVEGCLQAEADWRSRLALVASAVRGHFPDLLLVAIYVTELPGTWLDLGPLQGPATFARIAWGEGAVGSAALERAVQIIGEMKYFPGYVAAHREICSEIAVPVIRDRIVLAVIDAASAAPGRFGIVEAELLQGIAAQLALAWP